MVERGINRRRAIHALAALPAVAAFPSLARSAVSQPGAEGNSLKLFEIIVRKAGLSRDDFRRSWIAAHGMSALKQADGQGLVLSEAFGAGSEAAPAASYGYPIDGFVQSWLGSESDASALASDRDGPLIDRAASRAYLLREEVVVPAPRAEGIVKRTLLLARRPDLTHQQFLDHWLTRHAELAASVPGLIGAVFNPVLRDMDAGNSPWREIDGVTETWWDTGGGDIGGKVSSPQADKWMGDADNFLDLPRCRTINSIEHVLIAPR